MSNDPLSYKDFLRELSSAFQSEKKKKKPLDVWKELSFDFPLVSVDDLVVLRDFLQSEIKSGSFSLPLNKRALAGIVYLATKKSAPSTYSENASILSSSSSVSVSAHTSSSSSSAPGVTSASNAEQSADVQVIHTIAAHLFLNFFHLALKSELPQLLTWFQSYSSPLVTLESGESEEPFTLPAFTPIQEEEEGEGLKLEQQDSLPLPATSPKEFSDVLLCLRHFLSMCSYDLFSSLTSEQWMDYALTENILSIVSLIHDRPELSLPNQTLLFILRDRMLHRSSSADVDDGAILVSILASVAGTVTCNLHAPGTFAHKRLVADRNAREAKSTILQEIHSHIPYLVQRFKQQLNRVSIPTSSTADLSYAAQRELSALLQILSAHVDSISSSYGGGDNVWTFFTSYSLHSDVLSALENMKKLTESTAEKEDCMRSLQIFLLHSTVVSHGLTSFLLKNSSFVQEVAPYVTHTEFSASSAISVPALFSTLVWCLAFSVHSPEYKELVTTQCAFASQVCVAALREVVREEPALSSVSAALLVLKSVYWFLQLYRDHFASRSIKLDTSPLTAFARALDENVKQLSNRQVEKEENSGKEKDVARERQENEQEKLILYAKSIRHLFKDALESAKAQ